MGGRLRGLLCRLYEGSWVGYPWDSWVHRHRLGRVCHWFQRISGSDW